MNGITISLIFLIMISMILPASAIMYASGARTTPTDDNSDDGASDSDSTDNSDASDSVSTDNSGASSDSDSTDNSDASDSVSTDDNSNSPPSSDFSPDNVDSSSDTGSTGDNTDLSTSPTENNPGLSSESTLNNNTGNAADFVNTILEIHNRERAAVGVPPLTWSDTRAASAQAWAEHMATINQMVHSDDFSYGENIAGQNHGNSPPGNQDTLIKMVESWAVEKENWPGGVLTKENADLAGHYTQMVWKDTKQVGCGVAAASVNDYLVCQYSPTGNSIGKAPY